MLVLIFIVILAAGALPRLEGPVRRARHARRTRRSKLQGAVRREEGQGDQLRPLRPAAEGDRAVVRRAAQAAAEQVRNGRAADRHQPGRASAADCSSSCSGRRRRNGWPTSTPSCRSTIRITGNYHDMGAFASDVAQLPRIVTLNDVGIVNDKGVLTMEADRQDLPLSRRGRDREAAQGGQGEGRRRRARNEALAALFAACAASLLAGCGGESHQDLRAWMAGAGQGRQGQARSAAADQALRAVRLQRVRPARPVQAAQDRADQGRQQARARPHPAQGAARGVSARVAAHGGHAAARQDRSMRWCARPTRTSTRSRPATTWDRTSASSSASAMARFS